MKKSTVKERFQDSLIRGTGEAYVLMNTHPTFDFSLEIINTIGVCGYDAQSEGSRAVYLFELIEKSENETIWPEVFRKFAEIEDDAWAFQQLMEICYFRAKSGKKDGLRALKKNFAEHDIFGAQTFGSEFLFSLLGFDGLLFVLKKLGSLLRKHPDLSFDADFVRQYFNDPDIWVRVENAADEDIRTFLEQLVPNDVENGIRRVPPNYRSYEAFLERVEKGRAFGTWKLSPEEHQKLLTRFLNEQDSKKKAELLRGFGRSDYWGDVKTLLNVLADLEEEDEENEAFVFRLVRVLGNRQDENTRRYALRTIGEKAKMESSLILLKSNYEEGDEELFLKLIHQADAFEDIEVLACALTDLYQKHPTKNCEAPLTTLYRKMNCGIHREKILKILMKNNVLNPDIFEEMAFDANLDIRALYDQKKSGGPAFSSGKPT